MEYMNKTRKVSDGKPLILIEHIELMAMHTGNPAFKTEKFRKAVIEYRKYGMNPPQKAKWTLSDAVRYAKFSYRIHKQMEECERAVS